MPLLIPLDNVPPIGHRIRFMRELHGMQQNELAVAAKLETSHLCKIEAGKHQPSYETIERIAQALRVNVSQLTDWRTLDEAA